jgi:hypothetical protein
MRIASFRASTFFRPWQRLGNIRWRFCGRRGHSGPPNAPVQFHGGRPRTGAFASLLAVRPT